MIPTTFADAARRENDHAAIARLHACTATLDTRALGFHSRARRHLTAHWWALSAAVAAHRVDDEAAARIEAAADALTDAVATQAPLEDYHWGLLLHVARLADPRPPSVAERQLLELHDLRRWGRLPTQSSWSAKQLRRNGERIAWLIACGFADQAQATMARHMRRLRFHP